MFTIKKKLFYYKLEKELGLVCITVMGKRVRLIKLGGSTSWMGIVLILLCQHEGRSGGVLVCLKFHSM